MRIAFVSLLLLVACGGQTQSTEDNGGSGSSASSGGAGAVGGASGGASGGGGALPATPCGTIPPFHCVHNTCGGDLVMKPICVGDVYPSWACEEGWVPPDQCPDDACFHGPIYSCCDAVGNHSVPTCPGQASEKCPDDAYLTLNLGAQCPPAGTFPCGSTLPSGESLNCVLGLEYCEHSSNGADSCKTLPATCSPQAECGCLASVCGSCADAGIGAITCY